MASSITSATSSQPQHPYPCHVNTANFLSFKLQDETNYIPWKEQMLCLLESHGMLGFVDGPLEIPKLNGYAKMKTSESIIEAKYVEWKRSDSLVKGWIFGSVCEKAMGITVGLQTANEVWMRLRNAYDTPSMGPHITDLGKYVPLCIAIKRGDWDTAHEFLNRDKNVLTTKLNNLGQTALHIAVETGENLQMVEYLLKEMNPKLLPFLVDDLGLNAAHTAALVGNTAAAKMLVKKKPNVLFVADKKGLFPINLATAFSRKSTFLYFFKVSKRDIDFSQEEGYHNPFEGSSGALFLHDVIYNGFIDAAYVFLKEYPDMAKTIYMDRRSPLANVAGKLDLYYSGTEYNFS